jgi:hypothetical protein
MTPRPHHRLLLTVLVAVLTCGNVHAELLKAGDRLPELVLGNRTYREVQIRSVTVRTVMFTHTDGMASLRLRDLPPEWQTRFGYDPAAEIAAEAAEKKRPPPKPVTRPLSVIQRQMDQLLQKFGTPARLQRELSLRPRIEELNLRTKNQGRRPSCSVFAIVGALEFQHALLTNDAKRFSEEYLYWATDRTIQRAGRPPAEEGNDGLDAGYSLGEVGAALRAYGIPYEESMRYLQGTAAKDRPEPDTAIIGEARNLGRVSLINLPGRDTPTRINNLIHVLNASLPVPVGLAWPNDTTSRNGYLSKQIPNGKYGHAVTIVGYECPTGRMEDCVFLFKNSWGVQWGQGGYGRVTYEYLSKHLYEAVLLEIQR